MTNCDLCGKNNTSVLHSGLRDTALATKGVFSLVRCTSCGLVALDPQIAEKELSAYYPTDYAPYQQASRAKLFLKHLLWNADKRRIRRLVPEKGSIFEIGPSTGEYLSYVGQGFQLSGLEIDKNSASYAREKLGIAIEVGTVESYTPIKNHFDLVIMRFVMEHVRSPRAVFEKVNGMLKPGGWLLIRIPNFDSIERRVFGKYWHNYDVPRHFFIFDERTIKQYAQATGFQVLSIKHSFFPNEWIGSIRRFCVERGWFGLARFFSLGNPLLLAVFLPFSSMGCLIKKSSRVVALMRKR